MVELLSNGGATQGDTEATVLAQQRPEHRVGPKGGWQVHRSRDIRSTQGPSPWLEEAARVSFSAEGVCWLGDCYQVKGLWVEVNRL